MNPLKTGNSVLKSEALEINLRRTAARVVIPERQKILLQLTADHYGIQQETLKLLQEINHPYINWKQTLEELHRRAMNDFPYLNRHPRGLEGIAVYCDLYAGIARHADERSVRRLTLDRWLCYLEKIILTSGAQLERNLGGLGEVLDQLSRLANRSSQSLVSCTPALKRLISVLRPLEKPGGALLLEKSCQLLCTALEHGYQQWLDREDPLLWYRQHCLNLVDSAAQVPAAIASLSHRSLRAWLAEAQAIGRQGDTHTRLPQLLALPDNGDIARRYLAAAVSEGGSTEGWSNQVDQIRWLGKILSTDLLASVHEMALRETKRCYLNLLSQANCSGLERCLRETFVTLRQKRNAASPGVYDLVTTIGLEIAASGNPYLLKIVMDEMIDFGFQDPEFRGFTEEWSARINPLHLRDLRTYLTLIEADPHRTRCLLAALVIHLKIGGLFMVDGDLLQRDIARLLGRRIEPVYHQMKHLLKLLPIYFSDIGAEGELREVSTRMDEIQQGQDALCHFLRKQCHVECNPFLIPFTENVLQYWSTGDPSLVQPYLPSATYQSVLKDVGGRQAMQRILSLLKEREGSLDAVQDLEEDVLQRHLSDMGGAAATDLERLKLLLRLRRLLKRKYSLDSKDLFQRLHAFPHLSNERAAGLEKLLAAGDHEASLDGLLDILEELKALVLSRQEFQVIEDIYHKRHVAVGIPSLYGRYLERRLEAMGLILRVEFLANVLFERMIAEKLGYITNSTLQRINRWLRLMLQAVRLDGCRGEGLQAGISMLEEALQTQDFSVDQYINVFQFISHCIKYLIQVRFLDVYEAPLRRIIPQMLDKGLALRQPGEGSEEAVLRISEGFFRDLIAQSFALPQLDALVAKILHTLEKQREKLDRTRLGLLMSYDVENCFAPIESALNPREGSIFLGYKGYMIKYLAQHSFPVPPGFILSTEVFRTRTAVLAYPELQREQVERIRCEIERLEQLTGRRFGSRKNPLLLSVRSGAAVSMPGMMDTFLNVGINQEIAAGFGLRTGRPWAGWDAYRRFLQFWGMSFGLNRDLFDKLMRETKEKFEVPKKSQMQPEQMKEVALRYRELLANHRVQLVEEPFEQLLMCIELVLRSWHSDRAQVFRREMHIAEEWGTAVIIQKMVYGNLHERAGTGVVFTRHPRHGSDEVQLYGDFTIQGQGDDVVSGLVDTFPVSEWQRLSEGERTTVSLENNFPKTYRRLLQHAETLVHSLGMHPQEMEFTFESDDPKDLYLLQTRDLAYAKLSSVCTFVSGRTLEKAWIARGIGAGGGALSGRVAHNSADIAELRKRHPQDSVILLRPDTVPDDIPLILQADGILTALGGATSHAAVTAQRLGRTCVVGCSSMTVHEEEGRSRLADQVVVTGDFLSINGMEGSVYLGKHPTNRVGAETVRF